MVLSVVLSTIKEGDLITIIRTLLVFSIHPTLKQDNNQEGVATKTIEIRVERSCLLLLVHKEQKW